VFNGDDSIKFQPIFNFFLNKLSFFFSYDVSRILLGFISLFFFTKALMNTYKLIFFSLFFVLFWYSDVLFTIHIRMGLAISLLYFLLFFKKWDSKFSFFLIFIHYSVSIVFLLKYLIKKNYLIFPFGLFVFFIYYLISFSDFYRVYNLEIFNDYAFYYFVFLFVCFFFLKKRNLFLILYFCSIVIFKFYFFGELSARFPSVLIMFIPILLYYYEKSSSIDCKSRSF
jgi:hypothetical protein